MDLQVLVATMEQSDYSLLEKMNIRSNCIVINQCDENQDAEFDFGNYQTHWLNRKGRGLSVSRNLALEHATGDLCLLADDDLKYVDNYRDLILNQFERYPEADIVVFQVEGIEKKFKDYYKEPRKLNVLTAMKVSSVEIAFRTEKIKKAKIRFSEMFGAGARYQMGEESIFLSKCLKAGLNIMYVPVKIADLHMNESTWFKGFTKKYFMSKGAQFTAMSKEYSFLLILQFWIRKYKLYKGEISFLDSLKYMMQGRNEYLKQ